MTVYLTDQKTEKEKKRVKVFCNMTELTTTSLVRDCGEN